MLGNALQGGLIFWSMGIYTATFEDQFGESRARINLIESFLTISVNLLSPLLGWWVDKKSAKQVMTLGAVSMGLGLIMISQAGNLVSVWVVYATLLPLGVLSMGVLPSAALISRWFRRRRGLCLGLSLTGSSIGGALMPPLLTFLFMAWGWRTALLVVGVFVLLLAPLLYWFVADHPTDKGLTVESDAPNARESLAVVDQGDWSIQELLRCPTLWWQTLITGCLLAVSLGLLANLSLHAKDLGITVKQTAVLYSAISFCSFFGKIAFGWLIDKIGIKGTGTLTIALLLTALATLWGFPSYPGLIAASLTVGLGFGGVTPLWSNLPARTFGAGSVGRALGIMNPLHIPITAPSAPLAGYISDTTGSYELVWLVYAGFCLLAGVGLYFMRQPVRKTLPSAADL